MGDEAATAERAAYLRDLTPEQHTAFGWLRAACARTDAAIDALREVVRHPTPDTRRLLRPAGR